jgi:hypothetical protein
MSATISKKLSANDVGLTGSNQAGILVPKDPVVLSFFPQLGAQTKNPRLTIIVRELDNGARWNFNFIYYNGRLFGGTRNEYRLTCMTQYLRAIDARVGDELIFSKDENGSVLISCSRARVGAELNQDGVMVLTGGWKVINKGAKWAI